MMTRLIASLQLSSSPYVNALLALGAFVVIAKAADLFVDKVVRRFASFTKSELDDRVLDLVHRPVYYTIVLLGLEATAISLEPSPRTLYLVHGTVFTVITLVWAIAGARVANVLIEHGLSRVSDATGLGKDIIPLVENVTKFAVVAATLMVLLAVWKKDITPVLASAGIVGMAVAFAAKDTLANFFGGVSVFVDKPYKIGDYIVLDGGERGEVVAIGVRSTRIKTRDDVQITIPNSIIANTKVVNESAPEPNFRVRIPIGVAYGSDIDRVQEVLLAIALRNDNIVADPAPRVRFRAFGDSALNFELLAWAREPALRGKTVHEMNCEIYKEFGRRGIRIPFPQRDVHLQPAAPEPPAGEA
jgi:small-conductance mechanosensitive channel